MTLNFGIFLLMQSPSAKPSAEVYPRAIEIAQTAERLGFETVWLAEHHFSNYSHSSQPFVFLSHLAALTSRIRLGTAIIPLPLHDPLFVAEQAAAVDVLSGGRLELGLGKGYQKYQSDRLVIEKNADPEAFQEMVDLTVKALCGQPFTFEGKTRSVPETLIYPHPIQQPPPIWCVVNSSNPEAVAAAAGRGFNLFTGVLEPISSLTNVRKQVDALNLGHPIRIGTQRPVFVTETESEAAEIVEEARWNGRVSVGMRYEFGRIEQGVAVATPFPEEPSTETILEDHVIAGTPERCIHQIRTIQNGLGADTFNCSFWFGDMAQDRVLSSMSLFADKVMPAFSRSRTA
jgi:alkanesulfonate monooxygenase SsuD/methylene tetrahydromethanopterin reductase-like flavin-dependent oxidoreductase (luciferase family)